MNRFLGAFLIAGAVAVAVGACDDSSSGNGDFASGPASGTCAAYTTCDTCTPVNGCGWCFNSTGGLCASDPDQCSSASEFTWTWNQSGCPDVDASVAPAEAGTTTPSEAGTATPSEAGAAAPVADSGAAATEASAGD